MLCFVLFSFFLDLLLQGRYVLCYRLFFKDFLLHRFFLHRFLFGQ